jgi:hypothetical protein
MTNDNKIRFSQRIGKTPIRNVLQKDEMDERLKNRLFNCVDKAVKDRFGILEGLLYISQDFLEEYCDYFGELFSEKNNRYDVFSKELKKKIYEKDDSMFFYDYIEFVIEKYGYRCDELISELNNIFEQEKSAYRLDSKGSLISIIDEIELSEINRSEEIVAKYGGVYEHLIKSRNFFSDRERPDYKKCISESIHAIEAISRIILNDPNATLGDLVKKISVHPNLKTSIEKIYSFGSDVGGVRHGNKERENSDKLDKVGSDEARLILVLSHTIVNYLITKFI